MSLKLQIENDIKQAMLDKKKDELTALRSIKSAILLAETEKGASGELSDATEQKLLMKAAKQRKDSIEIFQSQGRSDLAQKEELELKVIERYLPEQMDESELKSEISKIIDETGAESIRDMGKVMGVASKRLAGKADGKAISEVVKSLLG